MKKNICGNKRTLKPIQWQFPKKCFFLSFFMFDVCACGAVRAIIYVVIVLMTTPILFCFFVSFDLNACSKKAIWLDFFLQSRMKHRDGIESFGRVAPFRHWFVAWVTCCMICTNLFSFYAATKHKKNKMFI